MVLPRLFLRSAALLAACSSLFAQTLKLESTERLPDPVVDPASEEAQHAIKRFSVAPGLTVSLWAAEPMLANPVAIAFDERGRLFVSETHRYRTSVLDIRHYMDMLELDLAARTIDDRVAMIRKVFGEEGAKQLAIEGEIVRLVEDRNHDGVADASTIFARGFNSVLDGIASGVLARQGKVWFSNIPSLWLLEQDATGTVAGKREELLRGFGVRFNYTGHDFHGLVFGPDGKIYFSIGDRGTHVRGKEGQLIDYPDEGAVYRSNPDGTEFELFARGLRNPQELIFDEFGNLFTGDNDSDNGDLERLVYLVEGGDSGWRVGYQHAPLSKGGPWLREGLWKTRFAGQPAYHLPPICYIEDGPSGVAYYPGTGLTPQFSHHIFICHFKGSISRSGIQTYTVRPEGAGFAVESTAPFLSNILPTDATFGPDGRFYVADWVEGWPKSRRGRIYAVDAANQDRAQSAVRREVRDLLAGGIQKMGTTELARLLGHADQRIRLEAQFTLAEAGVKNLEVFRATAADAEAPLLARIHALWGLGQLGRKGGAVAPALLAALGDAEAEVRAQAAKLLGDLRVAAAESALLARLTDAAPRVQFFAAQSLGKLKAQSASQPLLELLRQNDDRDLYLRVAAVHALEQIGPSPPLSSAIKDPAPPVRLGALLALRRLRSPDVAQFLEDPQRYLVREAALAINDAPIEAAFPALAVKLGQLPPNEEPTILRAINAHFRLGTPESAQSLAQHALRADASEFVRIECLQQLANWSDVPARDRLVGVYRPLPQRPSEPAAQALQGVLTELLRSAPTSVQLAAIAAADKLHQTAAKDALIAKVEDAAASGEVRARALEVLDRFDVPELPRLLDLTTADATSEVRLAALQILAKRAPSAALPLISKLASQGNEAEQQSAYRALGSLKMPETAHELVAGLDRLAAGQVAVGAQFELLDAVEKSVDPVVQARWQQVKDAWATGTDPLAPYRGALSGGDALRGSRLFSQNPVLACTRCHKVDGTGGDAGPDLTTIAARKPPEYILESVIKPNAQIAEGFNWVSLELTSGEYDGGMLHDESPTTVEIRHVDGTLVTIEKTKIKSRQSAPSSMPEIFAQVLSRAELRDLMAYLQHLKIDRALLQKQPRALQSNTTIDAGPGHE